jgi:DNA-binding transcriptional LysR family regulator
VSGAAKTAGNSTWAAKSLGIDTSTISHRIGRFEDELGLVVFERVHLTSGASGQGYARLGESLASAVNLQDLAVDEPCQVGGEKDDGIGDILC